MLMVKWDIDGRMGRGISEGDWDISTVLVGRDLYCTPSVNGSSYGGTYLREQACGEISQPIIDHLRRIRNGCD